MNNKFINIDFSDNDSESDYKLEESDSDNSTSDYEYIFDDDLNDLDYRSYDIDNKKFNKKRKRKITFEKSNIINDIKKNKISISNKNNIIKIKKIKKNKLSKKSKIKKKLNKDKYFKILSPKEKKKIINIEFELYKFNKKIIPNRYKIINLNTSIANKSIILNKIDIFNGMSEDSGEYYKLSKWINGISMIPFGIYKNPKLNINSNKINIQKHINTCYNYLDNTLYGQYNVKNKIMQVISQNIIKPNVKY